MADLLELVKALHKSATSSGGAVSTKSARADAMPCCGNSDRATSWPTEKPQKQQSLFLVAVVLIFQMAFACQILSAKNLPRDSVFYAFILCTSSVAVALSVLIVIHVLRHVHADIPVPVKVSFCGLLLYFCISYVLNATTPTSHHFFLVPAAYVLAAMSVVTQYTMKPTIAGVSCDGQTSCYVCYPTQLPAKDQIKEAPSLDGLHGCSAGTENVAARKDETLPTAS